MKKTVCAIAALTMLVSSGLVAQSRTKGRSGSRGSSGKTIKVWESDDSAKTYIMWAAKEFMKTHKGVRIEYEHVESTDARAKIELDGPAGVGADVFVAPHDHISALVAGGHVAENTDSAYLNDFIDAAKTAAVFGGKTYGYPLGIETYALFYNKDLMPEAPKTWDDVIAFAKTFNDSFINKYALVWPVGDSYYDYMFSGSFGKRLFGPNGDDRHQHNINSKEAIEGLKFFQGLRSQILDVPSADMTGDFANSCFTQGKAAMIITGPWKTEEFKKLGINFGITTLPAFPGKTQPATSFSGVRLAFVSEYSENKEIAQEFAAFLTTKANLEKRFEITKQIPPRNDITTNDPLSNGILEQTKYAVPMPTIPQMTAYWNAMGSCYGGIWDGEDIITDVNSAAAVVDAAK